MRKWAARESKIKLNSNVEIRAKQIQELKTSRRKRWINRFGSR